MLNIFNYNNELTLVQEVHLDFLIFSSSRLLHHHRIVVMFVLLGYKLIINEPNLLHLVL